MSKNIDKIVNEIALRLSNGGPVTVSQVAHAALTDRRFQKATKLTEIHDYLSACKIVKDSFERLYGKD